MIGFYLMSGDRPNREGGGVYHEGKLWTESAFVPMHQVSTPENFYLDPLPDGKAYTIMPATFEPKKKGPFFISVVTDVEFTLKKESSSHKKDSKKKKSRDAAKRGSTNGRGSAGEGGAAASARGGGGGLDAKLDSGHRLDDGKEAEDGHDQGAKDVLPSKAVEEEK
uniref:Uncharacterized protein n=1 Tax=Heterosigma akashiwo TaxID=2829 RepID=A0A7S3Y2S7_HETAK